MEKSLPPTAPKKQYWAIFVNYDVVFTGSHTECWFELLKRYSKLTMKQLAQQGIRIARHN
jgi:hypothetical protein